MSIYAHTSVCYTVLTSTRWHASSLSPAAVVCVLCFCFLQLCAALLIKLIQRRRSRRQPKADKEHNQNDAPDEEHARASCCDFVNKGSSRCDDQRAPFAPFSINLLPFFCCQDNSTKAYTQIHTNCRQGKEGNMKIRQTTPLRDCISDPAQKQTRSHTVRHHLLHNRSMHSHPDRTIP